MKIVTMYKSTDGQMYEKEEDCLKQDALCAEISEIILTLPKRPENTDFSYGHGFLQHRAETFFPAREALLRIGNRISPHQWYDQSISDKTVHPSWCGRIMYETNSALAKGWYRFMCVDKELREWGQPFFANNQCELKPEDFVELRES